MLPTRPARHRLIFGSCPSARGFATRFLPTLGRPHAVALHFVRCGQLTEGLPPSRSRPCRAHNKKATLVVASLFVFFGAPGAIRTPDPLVRSQVLYPSELRAQNCFKIDILAEREGFEPSVRL